MGNPTSASRWVKTSPRVQFLVWQRTSMPSPSGLCRNASPSERPPWQISGRPEPAPVEADPVGYQVRNPCRARSDVPVPSCPFLPALLALYPFRRCHSLPPYLSCVAVDSRESYAVSQRRPPFRIRDGHRGERRRNSPKVTSLGGGLPESCWVRCVRPACEWQTGVCGSCGQTASQPYRRHEEVSGVWTHSDQSLHRTRYGGVRGAEARGAPQPLQYVPAERPLGERSSILQVRPLGGCWESEGSILRSRSRIRGTGNPPGFFGTKRWKARNCFNYRPNGCAMEGFRRGNRTFTPESLAPG